VETAVALARAVNANLKDIYVREKVLRDLAELPFSVGSGPELRAMQDAGIPIDKLHSKARDEFAAPVRQKWNDFKHRIGGDEPRRHHETEGLT